MVEGKGLLAPCSWHEEKIQSVSLDQPSREEPHHPRIRLRLIRSWWATKIPNTEHGWPTRSPVRVSGQDGWWGSSRGANETWGFAVGTEWA